MSLEVWEKHMLIEVKGRSRREYCDFYKKSMESDTMAEDIKFLLQIIDNLQKQLKAVGK